MKEISIIHLKNKSIKLEIQDFVDSSIDTEELLQVDLNNIIMDICTFPVIFNRIANIKAQIEDLLRETQLDFDFFEAQLRDEKRKSLTREVDDNRGKGGMKIKYPTIDEVADAVILDPRYKSKRTELNQVKKGNDVADALYWAAKSKDQKLNAISAKIQPEDFEKGILDGTVNSVLIRSYKNIGSK